jgi:hypothetical protein
MASKVTNQFAISDANQVWLMFQLLRQTDYDISKFKLHLTQSLT